jgi:hypothetical protein
MLVASASPPVSYAANRSMGSAVKLERERDNRSVWSGDDFQKSTSGGDKRVGIVTVPGIKVVLCNFDSIHCVDSSA